MRIDIERLRELASKATRGEWFQSHRRANIDGMHSTEVYDDSGETIATMAWHPVPIPNGVRTDRQDNAEYVVAAQPQHITALLDRLEAAERERDGLVAHMGRLRSWSDCQGLTPHQRWEKMASALSETHTTSLARRDAEKQAEALEGVLHYCRLVPPAASSAEDVLRIIRQRAHGHRNYLRR